MSTPATLTSLEGTATPTAPAAGSRMLYAKSDGWYEENDAAAAKNLSLPATLWASDGSPAALTADAAGALTAAIAPFTLTGGQLKFPATQNASADANTLDDYEEGTWTPGLTCGTSGTITINASYTTGAYTKIGNIVTISIQLYITSVSSPVGTLTLTGLPFTNASGNRYNGGVSIYSDGLNTTGTTSMVAIMNAGATSLLIAHFTAGVAAAAAADIKALSVISINATYFAA